MGMLQLRAKDGHNLSAYMVAPEGKPRGGVVVIQEIFGLNSHIKRVTEQYAGPVTHVIASESASPYLDWSPMIENLTEYTVTGTHHSIWSPATLPEMAKVIAAALGTGCETEFA